MPPRQTRAHQPSKSLEQKGPPDTQPLSFLEILGSTLAAALGVQSSKNRKRDFSRGRVLPFILMGIGFTIFFVLALSGIVSLVTYK